MRQSNKSMPCHGRNVPEKQSELKSPADQPLIKTEPTAYHKSHQSQQPMHYDISIRSALLDVV